MQVLVHQETGIRVTDGARPRLLARGIRADWKWHGLQQLTARSFFSSTQFEILLLRGVPSHPESLPLLSLVLICTALGLGGVPSVYIADCI